MKNIGIITILDNNNYGNRLQNYALQQVLKNEENNVYTLYNKDYTNNKKFKYLRLIKHTIIKPNVTINSDRKNLFDKFNKNILFYNDEITVFNSKKVEKEFDYFIVGSDQVWNPNFSRLRDVDLLYFAPAYKRISYAASFGVNSIDEKYKQKVSKELKKFKAISVREEAGKKIAEKLTNRKDIEVLIDPTMLLDTEEWDKITIKPKQFKNEKYILNYFLGNLSDTRSNEIKKIADKNGYKIINLLDENDTYYISGPSEFLWLEKNAELICTDSFHSSVFAMLYNRPFIIFDRDEKDNAIIGEKNINSRLDTLINKFKLKNRKYNGKSITQENLHHDYTYAYEILKNERKKSEQFIKNALN